MSFVKLTVLHLGKPAASTINKPIKLMEKRFYLNKLLLAEGDDKIESESRTGRFLPAMRGNLQQKSCSLCTKTVMATNFCPECGARL